jgi:hypothetical protein
MSEKKAKTYADFILPASVVTRVDVSRLVRDAEWADNELTSVKVRSKAGVKKQVTPALSANLEAFLDQNDIDFGDSKGRTSLIKQLHLLKDKVPTIHLTFAVPADGKSLETLADWVRSKVHPQAVIEVGLQPALVGGVYIRTPNHVHDLTMRAALDGSHDVIVKELEALRGRK